MRTIVIAEAGVNHNGSLELALALIDAAVEAGADIVKFQTFTPERVISKHAPKAEYQKVHTDSQQSQLDMVRKLQLDQAAHSALIAHAQLKGIEFLSSPFDIESIETLQSLGLSRLKLPSGEITNGPYLLRAARSNLPLIVSTGMCTPLEIENALAALAFGYLHPAAVPQPGDFEAAFGSQPGAAYLEKHITLLHCTTEYPTPFSAVNLRAMDSLKSLFNLPVGYSDHTEGIVVPIAAVARGACVIEKHLTLDRAMPGPDHQASIEPKMFRSMVDCIRETEACLGSPQKRPTAGEAKNMLIARKSLVASKVIRKGQLFTEDNLTAKRPGGGISPMLFWEHLGRIADRDYEPDDLIES